MSKVTKRGRIKELERQVKGLTVLFSSLNTWSEYADSMLTELNHALPDPEYDAKCEAQEADIDASLDRHRERLGLSKPQLKQLDQSVFDGLDERWVAASVEENGIVRLYLSNENNSYDCEYHLAGTKYDTTDWQNSLIERDDIAKELLEVDLSGELTGSELCKAMLARGDKYVMCLVSDSSQEDTLLDGYSAAISSMTYNECFYGYDFTWLYATPINNQGEPLTAAEAGF